MLTKKTIKRLRQVEQFILAEPRRFDMKDGVTDNTGRTLEAPPCGTACCIGGAAYIIGKKIKKIKNLNFPWMSVESYATNWLGLTLEQAERLFYPYLIASLNEDGSVKGWPGYFVDAYEKAKSPIERAYVGLARIEHFIATNGDQ